MHVYTRGGGGGAECLCEDVMRAVFQDTDQLSSPDRDEQNKQTQGFMVGGSFSNVHISVKIPQEITQNNLNKDGERVKWTSLKICFQTL